MNLAKRARYSAPHIKEKLNLDNAREVVRFGHDWVNQQQLSAFNWPKKAEPFCVVGLCLFVQRENVLNTCRHFTRTRKYREEPLKKIMTMVHGADHEFGRAYRFGSLRASAQSFSSSKAMTTQPCPNASRSPRSKRTEQILPCCKNVASRWRCTGEEFRRSDLFLALHVEFLRRRSSRPGKSSRAALALIPDHGRAAPLLNLFCRGAFSRTLRRLAPNGRILFPFTFSGGCESRRNVRRLRPARWTPTT